MIVPGHPGNTGLRPLLMGSQGEVQAQMEYLFRGNHGLASQKELIEAGVAPGRAHALTRMKIAFAYGRIMPTEEFVQALFAGQDAVEIRNGVTVRRLRTNVFEFAYMNERVEADLNLGPGAAYECPYTLDKHLTGGKPAIQTK